MKINFKRHQWNPITGDVFVNSFWFFNILEKDSPIILNITNLLIYDRKIPSRHISLIKKIIEVEK